MERHTSNSGAMSAAEPVDITPKKDGGVLKTIKKEGTGSAKPTAGTTVKADAFCVMALDDIHSISSCVRPTPLLVIHYPFQ
ncbi:hypothetical protein ANCDUO_14723 [Ancylostoma duodenale]|uniref:Uncharacterized protein n=1 Tax=Ancylostoma duodenale TaxID=51022 RepID=A0A0C2CFK1_9BILA|nr:hypothetical protein ANCDUO_14723 [Ancylostoma duodenale]